MPISQSIVRFIAFPTFSYFHTFLCISVDERNAFLFDCDRRSIPLRYIISLYTNLPAQLNTQFTMFWVECCPEVSTTGDCTNHVCQFSAVCQLLDGLPHCICPASCSAQGDADSNGEAGPVCGTDGLVYPSPCHLRLFNCRLQGTVQVAYYGQCTGDDATASLIRSISELCLILCYKHHRFQPEQASCKLGRMAMENRPAWSTSRSCFLCLGGVCQ